MKSFNSIILVLCASLLLSACAHREGTYGTAGDTTVNAKGVFSTLADVATVADGSYDVYVPLSDFPRTDIRVEQDGGTGTITLTVLGSMESGCTWADADTCTYDDIGLDFYKAATFTTTPVKLIDNGDMLEGFTWMKLTFVVAGAAADASYKVMQAKIRPGV